MIVQSVLLASMLLSASGMPDANGRSRADALKHIAAEVRQSSPDADNAAFRRALAAMARVPREAFVAPADRRRAYAERSLPIGDEQTISDPYIVALMTAAADVPRGGTALDVGTGSGYQAAVLARIARSVVSIEIVAPLAEATRLRLRRLRYRNVEVRAGDGYAGAPDRAPFDAIVVAAGAAAVPQPLIDQLKVGGRLVMPIGSSWSNELILVMTKQPDGSVRRCSLGPSLFVPLTGKGERTDSPGVRDRTVPLCHAGAVGRIDFVPEGAEK